MTSKTRDYTPQQILSLPMGKNDANAATIGQYFTALLHTLFIETEGFSGKRPFGNSGWDQEIDKALIANEAVTGSFDGDGYIDDYDSAAASAIVFDTLTFLSKADWTTLQLPPKPKEWIVVPLYPQNEAVGVPVSVMLDEESAKLTAEEHNKANSAWNWVALRVPE